MNKNKPFPQHLDISELRTFGLFVGSPRSGHSLIGALLDAHPRAAIAHELAAFHWFMLGHPPKMLVEHCPEKAQSQAYTKRESFCVWQRGKTYDLSVPGQKKEPGQKVFVTGDKCGGVTTWELVHCARRGESPFEMLKRFEKGINLDLRIVIIVRNPWDMFASRVDPSVNNSDLSWVCTESSTPMKLIVAESAMTDAVAKHSNCHVAKFEDFITDMDGEMTRLLEFLGLDVVPEHLEACRSKVFKSASRSREKVTWTKEAKKIVREIIDRYSVFTGYGNVDEA